MSVAPLRAARSEALSDGELLAHVALGDTAALGALYDRYALSLTRYAARFDRADAEDVVQTVFMRVLRLASTFRPGTASARPWLFAITARVLQERTRSLARMGRALFRMHAHVGHAPSSHRDTQHDLERGVAALSRAKGTVLLLHEVEGFSCEEIAEMLSIPVGTVWTRLHHARQELRTYYRGDDT
jgi:RNA polymerase sigma factor (sigma-70 family)